MKQYETNNTKQTKKDKANQSYTFKIKTSIDQYQIRYNIYKTKYEKTKHHPIKKVFISLAKTKTEKYLLTTLFPRIIQDKDRTTWVPLDTKSNYISMQFC